MQPTIGRIVHYKLTADDAAAINKRREDYKKASQPGQDTGFQAHFGNYVSAGEIVPVIIVQVWPNEFGDKPGINGQAFLDGNDSLWITSKGEGTENGQWSWPPRV